MAGSAARVTEVQLRRAVLSDADAIARLHIASWRAAYRAELPEAYLAGLDEASRSEQWRARLVRTGMQTMLAEQHGELAGFCAHGAAQDEHLTSAWEIYGLHIAPQLRGSGIGTVLFADALESAKSAGAQTLTLWVVASNAPARRFYEAKGMQRDGAGKRRELAPMVALREVRYRIAPLQSEDTLSR